MIFHEAGSSLACLHPHGILHTIAKRPQENILHRKTRFQRVLGPHGPPGGSLRTLREYLEILFFRRRQPKIMVFSRFDGTALVSDLEPRDRPKLNKSSKARHNRRLVG